MGYIISKEQLEGARKRERFFSSLNESISARKRNAYLGEVTVFLSHNHILLMMQHILQLSKMVLPRIIHM